MRRITAEAMEDGAFGIATALIYPPNSYSPDSELIEVARVDILVHHHGGGTRAHVHLDGGSGAPDDDHGDHDHDHALRPGETALEAPEPAEGWHAHAQQPFHLAARPPATRVARVESVAAVRPVPHVAPLAARARATRARAPPPPPSL